MRRDAVAELLHGHFDTAEFFCATNQREHAFDRFFQPDEPYSWPLCVNHVEDEPKTEGV